MSLNESNKPLTTFDALQLQITSYKSLVGDLSLRCRQAEQLAEIVVNKTLNTEQMQALVVQCVGEHFTTRQTERTVQQQAVIQATLVFVNTMLQGIKTADIASVETNLVAIAKALSLVAEVENPK